jgi:hypothetical protein
LRRYSRSLDSFDFGDGIVIQAVRVGFAVLLLGVL